MNSPSEKTKTLGASALQKEHLAWLNSVAHVYLQGQQYNKALPLLILLLELQPNNAAPLISMAYAHYQLEQYQHAIEYCERYEKKAHDTTASALHLLRSFCHLKIGQTELAHNYHQRYINARTKP